jgi:hemolysin III
MYRLLRPTPLDGMRLMIRDNAHEEVANALTHGIGALAALAAGAVLITLAAVWGDGWQIASAIVFVATLLLLYLASTLYHAIPHPVAKQRLKVLDHCAIYLLIAGTYTPFSLIGLREHGGGWMLLTVWGLAAAGVVFKLFYTGRFRGLSTAIYLGMGWLALVAIDEMLAAIPMVTLGWLVAGGLAYTVGTIFYMNQRLPYSHAVWHGFVLLGSCLHFVAVSQQVLLQG